MQYIHKYIISTPNDKQYIKIYTYNKELKGSAHKHDNSIFNVQAVGEIKARGDSEEGYVQNNDGIN